MFVYQSPTISFLNKNIKPFGWSVTKLVRFFQDPKMANLLTGPGSQQQQL